MYTTCHLCQLEFICNADGIEHALMEHPYECNSCKTHFSTNNDLLTHFAESHKNLCSKCHAKIGEDEAAMQQHMRQYHTETPEISPAPCPIATSKYWCYECQVDLSNSRDFWRHCLTLHGNKCPLCHVPLTNNLQWVNHLKTAHALFPCNECYEIFDDRGEKKRHFNDVHRISCSLCVANYTFVNRACKEQHMNEVHRVQCFICQVIFASKEAMLWHYHVEHMLECYLCDKVFAKRADRKRHIRLVHQVECEVCRGLYGSVDELRVHGVNVHGMVYEEVAGVWNGIIMIGRAIRSYVGASFNFQSLQDHLE